MSIHGLESGNRLALGVPVGRRTNPSPGEPVSFTPRFVGFSGRSLLAVLAFLASTSSLQAQRGLGSGVAQIALIARVAPAAAFHGVSPTRGTVHAVGVKEARVTVRLSANTGYRLVVLGTGTEPNRPLARVWVRGADGRFQRLSPGSSVTVARGAHTAGEWDREVSYRIEAPASADPGQTLPVRYEIRIDPTI